MTTAKLARELKVRVYTPGREQGPTKVNYEVLSAGTGVQVLSGANTIAAQNAYVIVAIGEQSWFRVAEADLTDFVY